MLSNCGILYVLNNTGKFKNWHRVKIHIWITWFLLFVKIVNTQETQKIATLREQNYLHCKVMNYMEKRRPSIFPLCSHYCHDVVMLLGIPVCLLWTITALLCRKQWFQSDIIVWSSGYSPLYVSQHKMFGVMCRKRALPTNECCIRCSWWSKSLL